MNEKLKYYDRLRREYPEVISKEQFRKIAHISKRTARYLLCSGKVACRNTGKKTRQYKIRIEDVISYLIDRELHPADYALPKEWRKKAHKSTAVEDGITLQLTDEERVKFRRYVAQALGDYPDLLSVPQAADFLGYCEATVLRWRQADQLKTFNISGKYLIPKEYYAEFLASPYCCNIAKKTWKHQLLIRTFLEKKKKKKRVI